MKTQTTKVGPGRPRKQIQIRKKLSVNLSDFKTAISLMKLGKSMPTVSGIMRGVFTHNEVVAIRSFAVKNGYLPMKKSTVQAHKTRLAKRNNQTIEGVYVWGENKVPQVPQVDAEEELSSLMEQEFAKEVAVEAAAEVVKPKSSVTRFMSEKTLTIDFKGIIMQVQIASIEVKDDTIVVR